MSVVACVTDVCVCSGRVGGVLNVASTLQLQNDSFHKHTQCLLPFSYPLWENKRQKKQRGVHKVKARCIIPLPALIHPPRLRQGRSISSCNSTAASNFIMQMRPQGELVPLLSWQPLIKHPSARTLSHKHCPLFGSGRRNKVKCAMSGDVLKAEL